MRSLLKTAFLLCVIVLTCNGLWGCGGGGGDPIKPPPPPPSDELANVSGSIALPPGTNIPLDELEVFTFLGGKFASNGKGAFILRASPDVPLSLAAAISSQDDPLLIGLIRSSHIEGGTLVLNAHSTAQAMLFLTPFVATVDPVEINAILGHLESMPSFDALVTAINQVVSSGQSPFAGSNPDLSQAFLNAYGDILSFIDSNLRVGQRSAEIITYPSIDPKYDEGDVHFSIKKNGNPAGDTSFFQAKNTDWRVMNLWAYPWKEDVEDHYDANDPHRIELGWIAAWNCWPSTSDLVKSGLYQIPGWPPSGFTNILDFELDSSEIARWEVVAYGPGLFYTESLSEHEKAICDKTNMQTFIHCIFIPMFQTIVGFSPLKLTCAADVIVAGHGQEILTLFNAATYPEGFDLDSFIAGTITTTGTVAGNLLFNCGSEIISLGGEAFVKYILSILKVWDLFANVPEAVVAIVGNLLTNPKFPYDIHIYYTPTAEAVIASVPPFYVGHEITFDASASYDHDGGYITDYDWNLDDNSQIGGSGALVIEHAYAEAGTYYVGLTVTDDEGETDELDNKLKVVVVDEGVFYDPIPVAKADPIVQLENEQVHFYDNGSYDPDGGDIVKFEWDWENDGVFDVEGVSQYHSWVAQGQYDVQLRVTDDEGASSVLDQPLQVTIIEVGGNLPPTAMATPNKTEINVYDSVFFENESYDPDGINDIVKYEWDFSFDGVLFNVESQDLGPLRQFNEAGVFNVQLRVTDSADHTDMLDEPIVINVSDPCPTDSNNTYIDAVEVPFGTFTNDQVCSPDDKEDWFKFAVSGALSGSLDLTITNATGPCFLTVYNESQAPFPNGPHLATTQVNPSGSIDLTALNLEPGNYYVRILHFGTDLLVREYKFENNGLSDDECQPDSNNAYTEAVVVDFGEMVDNQIVCYPDDKMDWFKFTSAGDLTGTIDLILTNSTGNADMTLYNESQAPNQSSNLGWDQAYPGAPASIPLDSLGVGTYYVRIRHLGNDYQIREYKFENDGVVDPGPQGDGWARTWGGEGSDFGHGVTIDGSGNAYITGRFMYTVDFDPGPGVNEQASNGYGDIFLSKFDSNGDFQWTRTWGGISFFDEGLGVAVDGSGNVYITGFFHHTADFDPGPGVDEHTSNGYGDIFLSKFDSAGVFQWVRTWGGSDDDRGNGVAIDGSGNAYITGRFGGTVDFDPGPGVDEHTSNGSCDVFLSKFDSNGVFQWARTWGGSSDDRGFAVAVDGSGNAYITGYFNGTADFNPGPGVDEHTSNGYGDIFLSKFGSAGNFQWARTWGGSGSEFGDGVAIDGSGNAYITGYFWGTADFDPGPGIDEYTSNGDLDIFLSKFDSAGDFQWARTWGGGVGDEGHGVAIDGSGSAYITGKFSGTVDFDPSPGVDEHTSNGVYDIFLSKFDSAGVFQWARAWGGSYTVLGYGVAIDGSGNAYITGGFQSTVDFDPGPGIDEHTSNGLSDIFLSKFPPDGNW